LPNSPDGRENPFFVYPVRVQNPDRVYKKRFGRTAGNQISRKCPSLSLLKIKILYLLKFKKYYD
jgi:hypothetical protein